MLAGPAECRQSVLDALSTSSFVAKAEGSGGHRAMQEEREGSSGGGVSGDSLAIAATVLVALVGYAVRPLPGDDPHRFALSGALHDVSPDPA